MPSLPVVDDRIRDGLRDIYSSKGRIKLVYRHGSLKDKGICNTAEQLGLDVDRFTECVEEQPTRIL